MRLDEVKTVLYNWEKSMFGLLQRKRVPITEVVTPERIPVPFPTARIPVRLVQADVQRSYEEVAQSLGFDPAELIRAQLLEFFEQENLKLYEYTEVFDWLQEKRIEAGATHWLWRPLREKDIITEYTWGLSNGIYNDGFYHSKQWSCRPYDRLVPLHALEKVAKIEEEFEGRVKIFVSDYASQDPDPFIMVRPAGSVSGDTEPYHHIFDVWDEPGFGA